MELTSEIVAGLEKQNIQRLIDEQAKRLNMCSIGWHLVEGEFESDLKAIYLCNFKEGTFDPFTALDSPDKQLYLRMALNHLGVTGEFFVGHPSLVEGNF